MHYDKFKKNYPYTSKSRGSIRHPNSPKGKPKVFISHKSEDKAFCRMIANYFDQVNIDYYFDENDSELQIADQTNDHKKVTNCIKKGIVNSTHMLCVISEHTYKSVWVPYELGYGQAALCDINFIGEGKSLIEPQQRVVFEPDIIMSVLVIKDIPEDKIPSYLHGFNVIKSFEDFKNYTSKITGNPLLEKDSTKLKSVKNDLMNYVLR